MKLGKFYNYPNELESAISANKLQINILRSKKRM